MPDTTPLPFSAQAFQNPPARLRGAPFWAWNCDLDRDELFRQIACFREMGFGGFHMHVRSGLSTPYMGEEFLNLISDCTDEASRQGLIPRLYDEDRWPSGFGGGLVTKDHPEYRRRALRFARTPAPDAAETVARYDIRLAPDGTLLSCRTLREGEAAAGDEWLAQIIVSPDSPRFNNAAYVDVLNPAAVRAFLDSTYVRFRERLGDRFGRVAPSVFTDEPQTYPLSSLKGTSAQDAAFLPWTDDLPQTFFAATGYNLPDAIPALFWNLPDGGSAKLRYGFFDHIAERFARAFPDQVGAWCSQAGIAFTGHLYSEFPLRMQTTTAGEAMRFYRGMTIPGIDMLCGKHEYTTAKQAQSAVRQYGKDGMMSELYGVLGWDLDFRGHKHHGDWQAALGVTLRVPHLSWVSMKGEAKRDYPQSIFYQSPWYRKYPLIEDHFARVNLAMTQGRPVCRIGVIHPIESMWLHVSDAAETAAVERLEGQFRDITEWLLFSQLDFDFISEALLPSLCPRGSAPLAVGEARYDAIVVPACETMRETTWERLDAFRKAGGTLIFLGDAPARIDALPDGRPALLAGQSRRIPFTQDALADALSAVREVRAAGTDGKPSDLIYRMQADADGRWVFLAHGRNPEKPDISAPVPTRLTFRGLWNVTLFDTLRGTDQPLEVTQKNGHTALTVRLYAHDSLLLRLTPGTAAEARPAPEPAAQKEAIALPIPSVNAYRTDEPNPLLLDTAEYRLDDGDWQPEEEILRLDTRCRKLLGWAPVNGGSAQPWCTPPEPSRHRLSLRFRIRSQLSLSGVSLALERLEETEIRFNGATVPSVATGFYTDHDIRTVALPELTAGENLLELTFPFNKRETAEWCYLLGDFGVRVCGREKTVIPRAPMLGFGSITEQSLPFYGGRLTYCIPFTAPRDGTLTVHIPQFRAALLECAVDNGVPQPIAFAPYTASLHVTAGAHTLYLSAYLNRTNTFGALHNTDRKETWIGPALWRTEGDRWCYEYELSEEGILHTPVVTLLV